MVQDQPPKEKFWLRLCHPASKNAVRNSQAKRCQLLGTYQFSSSSSCTLYSYTMQTSQAQSQPRSSWGLVSKTTTKTENPRIIYVPPPQKKKFLVILVFFFSLQKHCHVGCSPHHAVWYKDLFESSNNSEAPIQ